MDTVSPQRPRRYSIRDGRVGNSLTAADRGWRGKHDFSVGEAVVSPRHGIGTVVERTMRPHNGTEREYLAINVGRRGLRLLVPVDGEPSAYLRPLSSQKEVSEALAALAGDPQALSGNWRTRQKEAVQRFGIGNLLSTAELVRDFAHVARGRRLASSDRELYKSARELLEDELQAVLDIGSQTAMKKIRDCLELSGTVPGPK